MKLTATPREETASVLIEGTEIPQCLVTVYRYNVDDSPMILRGALNVAVTKGSFTFEDTEAPFNEPLRYVLLFEIDQYNSRIVQQNLITNPSFETNTTSWSAGTGRTITRVHLLAPGGETGDTQVYDVREIIPTQSPSLYPAYPNAAMQDVVRDPDTNEWYVSQTIAGTVGSAASTVISRLTPDGQLMSSMTLNNAGLGANIDLQRIGTDVWIWMPYRTVDAGGVTTANDLARVRYSPGVKNKASLTAADYLAINDFTTAYTTAKLDVLNDYAIVRLETGSGSTRTETYYRRRISEMLAGTNVIYGQIGPFSIDPANPNMLGTTLQGFAFYSDQLYRYTGELQQSTIHAFTTGRDPSKIPSLLSLYTVPASAVTTPDVAFQYSLDVSTLGNRIDGTALGGYHDPTGLSIYRQSSGEIVTMVGVTVGASTARQHTTFLYTQQPSLARGEEVNSAFVGTDVAMLSYRATQAGDSTENPPDAPLARVLANFPTSTTALDYAFSFHSRLNDDPLSYYFGSEIVIGTVPQTWGDAFSMYPNWSLPLSQNLTWGDGQYARISGISDEWLPIVEDPLDGDYSTDTGVWDPETGTLTIESPRADLRTRNYVGNPTFGASTSGYTASATSGSTPVLSTITYETETVLQIATTDTTVGGRVTFSANGLTPGQEYRAAVLAKVPVGQTLQLSLLGGTVLSLGVVGDEFNDWLIDSINFTATASIEQVVILIGDRYLGNAIVDHVSVTLPDVDYFDGSLPDDQDFFYTWVGAPNASMSERVPHSTLFAPTTDPHTEYAVNWDVSPISTLPVEVTIGVMDEEGNDLVTPVHATVPAGTLTGGGGYGEGAYGDGPFGSGSGTATGPPVRVTLPTVDTREWLPGWRPYVMIGAPGARVVFNSSYHVYNRPAFVPYQIGLRARVIAPDNSVVLESETLDYVSVVHWSELRWEFTLPSTVAGQYRIEIVPETTWEAARTAWQLDGVMLEKRPYQAGKLDYLDGSVPKPDTAVPGWLAPEDVGEFDSTNGTTLIRWLGTAHASASEFVAASEATIVLETELEPPSGTDLAPIPDCEPINLTDPTLPSLNGWFTLQLLGDLSYEARSESFAIINRRTPIVISQVRASASGSMVLLLQTLNERQRLLDLVTPGRVLLVRNPDPQYPENGWYLAVGAVSEARIAPDHRLPYRRFSFEFQVVDRPGGLIAAPHDVTWEDVNAVYTSWGPVIAPESVAANADTWTELINQRPAIETPFDTPTGSYA